VRLFSLAFAMMKAAERDDAVADEAGVGGEDHVGGSGLGFDEADLCDLAEGAVELLPLHGSALARGAMDVAGHPGIDDVVDLVVLWRAHEECRLAVGFERGDEASVEGSGGSHVRVCAGLAAASMPRVEAQAYLAMGYR
jgi:hypothetical protein